VQGLGFKAQSLGLMGRVWGSGFRISGRIEDLGHTLPHTHAFEAAGPPGLVRRPDREAPPREGRSPEPPLARVLPGVGVHRTTPTPTPVLFGVWRLGLKSVGFGI
jgi:hypothetical protein